MPTFIDLFCGIGGFRIGMEKAGFKCVFSCEIDKNCRETYSRNFGDIPYGDITKLDEKTLPEFDVLCAGFPCQPFSISGRKMGFTDTRGTLFFDICRIIKEKHPQIVFLENVKYLIYHDGERTFSIIKRELENLGYTVTWKILNANRFGVPQNRERIIIIGMRNGKRFPFENIKESEIVALKNFLDEETDTEYLEESEYTLIENPKMQEKSGLIFAGYRNKSTRKKGVLPNTMHLSRVHRQPNRIYSAEGTNPTLSAQETEGRYFILLGNGKVRKLSLNECWKIMGYPDSYIKTGSRSVQYHQIGNSVCVPMIYEIAKELKNFYI